jgi:hypothetical protein
MSPHNMATRVSPSPSPQPPPQPEPPSPSLLAPPVKTSMKDLQYCSLTSHIRVQKTQLDSCIVRNTLACTNVIFSLQLYPKFCKTRRRTRNHPLQLLHLNLL